MAISWIFFYQPDESWKTSVVFTPTETWEYLEAPSEQRRDALILRHVQPFQFSALRAIYKFRPKNPPLTWIVPPGWPNGGDWCQKYIYLKQPTVKGRHQWIFPKFLERHNQKSKELLIRTYCFPFQEMFRVLKPGAKLSFLDYVQLPAYNASDAKHNELLLKAQGFYGREREGLVVLGRGSTFWLNMFKMSKFTLFCSGRTDAFWLYNMYIFHWKKDNKYNII